MGKLWFSKPNCSLAHTIVYVYFSFLGMLKKWRQQKRKVDAENEKVFRSRAILARNCKASSSAGVESCESRTADYLTHGGKER